MLVNKIFTVKKKKGRYKYGLREGTPWIGSIGIESDFQYYINVRNITNIKYKYVKNINISHAFLCRERERQCMKMQMIKQMRPNVINR